MLRTGAPWFCTSCPQARAHRKPGRGIADIFLAAKTLAAEIERLAVEFQAVRNRVGWRAIGLQEIDTSAESLDEIWPIHRGQHRDRARPPRAPGHPHHRKVTS